jgi:hypothetical protein
LISPGAGFLGVAHGTPFLKHKLINILQPYSTITY